MKQRLSTFFVILIFIFANISLNLNIWKEIIQFNQPDTIQSGDGVSLEVLIEETYHRIINFQNPFLIQNTFYPFETNISLSDPVTTYAVLFIPLKLIFNTHQSMLLILMLNLFLAEICMYFVLRKFDVSPIISLIFGLVYAFTPFISIRIQEHYTYTSIFYFPLIFYVIREFIVSEKKSTKSFFALATSFLFAVLLLTNFYFFITSVFLGILYIIFFFFVDRKTILRLIYLNYKYLIFSIAIFIIFISPWIWAVNKFLFFERVAQTPGFGGAIELSASLLSIITPSELNPFYRFIISQITVIPSVIEKYRKFYFSYGQHFAYPGIIILLSYGFLIVRWKQFNRGIKNLIMPHFVISLVFLTLLLGPFLKIVNKWRFNLEGVDVVIPLPFFIVHYIPGLNMMRDPTRLLPIFVFLACIVAGIVINNLYKKTTTKYFFICCLLIIFIIDQSYYRSEKIVERAPNKIFSKIERDTSNFTVLSIPFTLRDGFKYSGFVHEKMNIYGTIIHNKPVIGGYIARVGSDVFSYYNQLPFISYITTTVDRGNYNPYTELPLGKKTAPINHPKEDIINEIEFLTIKYITLKNDESYSEEMKSLIEELGFNRIEEDGQYHLYMRELVGSTLATIQFGSNTDYLSVVSGLSVTGENKFRVTTENKVRLFVPQGATKLLYLTAETNKSISVAVYINKKLSESLRMEPGKKTYSINTKRAMREDKINEIIFLIDKEKFGEGARINFYSLVLDNKGK